MFQEPDVQAKDSTAQQGSSSLRTSRSSRKIQSDSGEVIVDVDVFSLTFK